MKKVFLSILLALLIALAPCAWAEETDWYAEKAAELTAGLYELISFDRFAEYFTGSEEIHEQIDAWEQAMEKEPLSVKGYDMPDSELLMSMAGMQGISLPDVMAEYVERRLGSTLVSMVNSSYGGATFLAAASMSTLFEGYVMPEGFKPCIVIYEYEGICVSVSFAEIGEGVVMATAEFCAPEVVDML